MYHISSRLRACTVSLLKLLFLLLVLLFGLNQTAFAADDNGKLLSPEQAFVPQLIVHDQDVRVRFVIAKGYYLYQNKIQVSTKPEGLFDAAQFVQSGTQKHDEFFGTQQVYYNHADVLWRYSAGAQTVPYQLTLSYQGCAEAGICYPPVENTLTISRTGKYSIASQPLHGQPDVDTFTKPREKKPPAAWSGSSGSDSLFQLSRATLITNLMTFFIAGMGLSLTACMYPLLPIVSAIVMGSRKKATKWRAFVLSFVYVQGLAFTYTIVGIVTARTGSFLTGWLQQPAVVLTAAAILVILALSMFDLYSIQLPTRWQSYFQRVSGRFRGGHLLSVMVMGALSALIVGPCVAPPLAFALGYIGQSGDATLGGMALYVMALGTGIPLILISVFGVHIMPRAGGWMTGVKYLFGLMLLGAATYIATPFLHYYLVVTIYTLLMLVPALYLGWQWYHSQGRQRWFNAVAGVLFLTSGIFFVAASVVNYATPLHRFLTLTPPNNQYFGRYFKEPEQLSQAMQQLFDDNPDKPVLVDFYADWCISCKEMTAFTLSKASVRRVIEEERFLQIDVTNNTPAQRRMMQQYGLYGPPGLFVVHSNGYRSQPLVGYVPASELLSWYDKQIQKVQ
ncbi:protein-disulfide reductase DsbD [Snodgrassella sp. ESL0253]|uniref:protein-disulfide reductase DsbD n=1 Tax=Snodgrassella sp. ESL0253 TaxID=2705031 RepID=UPI0015822B74|nr:protein-disulfide reductase DsbD [Snodgrassella sp. ESL0253]NUE66622.1 protein-disulfide reductase DsbD [Snodgrassella sp. ESL0253]